MKVDLSNKETWDVIYAGLKLVYGDKYDNQTISMHCGCVPYFHIEPPAETGTKGSTTIPGQDEVAAPEPIKRRMEKIANEAKELAKEIDATQP